MTASIKLKEHGVRLDRPQGSGATDRYKWMQAKNKAQRAQPVFHPQGAWLG